MSFREFKTHDVISSPITDAAYDVGTRRPKVENVKVGVCTRVHDDVRAIGSQEVGCVGHSGSGVLRVSFANAAVFPSPIPCFITLWYDLLGPLCTASSSMNFLLFP